jgi:hypothetical protein
MRVLVLTLAVAASARATEESAALWRITEFGHQPTAIAIDRTATHVAVGHLDGKLVVLDMRGKSIGSHLVEHGGAILALGFSPDGNLLASGGVDGRVHVWRLPKAGSIAFENVLTTRIGAPVTALAFARDALYAGGGEARIIEGKVVDRGDCVIRSWRVADGTVVGIEPERAWSGHGDAIQALSVGTAGDVIRSASRDLTVRSWSAEHGGSSCFAMPTRYCQAVAFAGEGRLAVARCYDQLAVWDLERSSELRRWSARSLCEHALLVDGGSVIAGREGTAQGAGGISRFAIDEGSEIDESPASGDPILMALAPDAHVVAAIVEEGTRTWTSADCCVHAVSGWSVRLWRFGSEIGEPTRR